MVTRIYVDNFRCLVNFELKLDETNILLGANGSGKTSVLDALRRIQNLVARGGRIEEEFPTSDLSLLQDHLSNLREAVSLAIGATHGT